MWLLIITILTVYLFYHLYWKRRDLPPGPMPLPFLGNLLQLAQKPSRYETFLNWKKEYGNIFTFWLSSHPMVMVCDYRIMYDAFVKDYSDELSSKFVFKKLMDTVRGGSYGLLETSGDLWREQRRFTLTTLRNFGLGKNLMEQKILDEVEAMIKNIKKDEVESDGVCDIMGILDICVGSIINNIIFGYRFEGDKVGEFFKIKQNLSDLFLHVMKPLNQLVNMFYFLKHIEPFKSVANQSEVYMANIFEFIDEQIENHEKTLDKNNLNTESIDFCEEYLKEIYKNDGKDDDRYFSKLQLRNICIDLWGAGLETTVNTCQFGVIYLLNNPSVYEKIKKEINDNVDHDKLITMNDKPKLQYVQAFINEVQRMTNVFLMNTFHIASKDVNINGYLIKEGTIVVPQISTVLYDEKIFPEPFEFKPERFLDGSGNLRKIDEMIPFSLGKRQCIGEALARMELFLILSNLIKHFDLKPENDTPPSMNKKFGIAVQPEPFKIRVKTVE